MDHRALARAYVYVVAVALVLVGLSAAWMRVELATAAASQTVESFNVVFFHHHVITSYGVVPLAIPATIGHLVLPDRLGRTRLEWIAMGYAALLMTLLGTAVLISLITVRDMPNLALGLPLLGVGMAGMGLPLLASCRTSERSLFGSPLAIGLALIGFGQLARPSWYAAPQFRLPDPVSAPAGGAERHQCGADDRRVGVDDRPGSGGVGMRSSAVMRHSIFALALLVLVPLGVPSVMAPLGCANNQAHLDWRPGLSAIDFNGLYAFEFAEYREFAERGEANLLFDRFHGVSEPEAASAMQAIGERLRASATPQELTIVDLSSAGRVQWLDARGKQSEADVEWFAATPERGHAVLLAGTRLGVVIDRASIVIDAGSLLGPEFGGWQFTMLVVGDELTVFALPELGGSVMPDEPGYVFEFTVAPQASKPWQISVGRVSVSP